MKFYNLLWSCALITAFAVNAAENSSPMKVKSIESRYSGAHALYGSSTIPDQGCTLKDRGIIVETDAGSKTMISVALSALVSGKQAIVQVSGCTMISPGHGVETAPKITKFHMLAE
ncbi:hypothetical protein [Photobacterium rosenbergii]|uniref:Uncharacterized protein n=1 Tax=Photobacterium rosenbergii TaxID=294936 RepID=A0ABU3ZE91_9GAMM|nr:hypothetical protein [Photobacterium rosenbergii]MDV5168338.1 hypothetical protein [Photobacterium rosenbergii]